MRFTEQHDALREMVRGVVDKEINPHVDAWEAAGAFPAHELFPKLGALGLLGLEYDPEYGGMGVDHSFTVVLGEELGLDRAVEILSIVGTGFVLRTLARQALDFVPGFGWAVKGAVGFSGTIALGQAAIAYFESGAPLRVSRMQRVNRQLEKVTSRLPGPLKGLASR